MLFRRREKQSSYQKFRNLVWPRMGWRRTYHYLKHRSIRIPDTTYSIAMGLTIGCAVSWTPTFGTHLIQAVAFCWMLRANWLASMVGTIFGNPWTTPFLMWIAYQVGETMFAIAGYDAMYGDMVKPQTMGELMRHPMSVYYPMLIGGYVCGVVTAVPFYFFFHNVIDGARKARKARIQAKAHKAAMEVTGQEQ